MENQVRCYSDISAEAFNLEKIITDTSSDQVGRVFKSVRNFYIHWYTLTMLIFRTVNN